MNKRNTTSRLILGVGLGAALFASSVSADNIDNLSEKLIQLRADVEELSADLSLAREEHKQRMSALASQRSELQARVKRTSATQDKLVKELELNLELAKQAGADDELLKPVLLDAIAKAEERILFGLPFKVDDRLSAIIDIREQLTKGLMTPSRAATRLWALYEDEIRLTRENGIYRQAIDIEGEIILADVARLGMVMMYFVTTDDRHGVVVKNGSDWIYKVTSEKSDSKQIARLFDSLRKQIRTGYFELPAAI